MNEIKVPEFLRHEKNKQYAHVKIVDEQEILELEEIVNSGSELPLGIDMERLPLELVKDQEKYINMDTLPNNIIKKAVPVTNNDELIEIKKSVINNGGVSPEGIGFTWLNGYRKFFYEDNYEYYTIHYNFYRIILLNEEEVDLTLKVINAKSLESISNTLLFFKNLVIVMIVLSVIVIVLSLFVGLM